MCRTLLEIKDLHIGYAILIGGALVAAAVLWLRREVRFGRMAPDEFRPSLAWVGGVALVIAAGLYVASHYVAPIRIRSYGVMLMVAFVVGIAVSMRRADRYHVDPLYVIDFALFVLAGSILGSRGLYIWLNWGDEYAQDPSSVFNVWEGGLAFHGGLIGGVVGAMLFCRWRRLRLPVVADLTAPSIAFGYAIARLGCFLNGCCHGGPTSVPWGVDFPLDDIPTPVHPVQLYAGLGSLVLGFALLGLTRAVRVPGHLFLWYLVFYSALRSLMEHFRRGFTAEPLALWPALTQAQAASIVVAGAALAVIIATRGRVGYPLPEPESPNTEGRSERDGRKRRKKRRKKGS